MPFDTPLALVRDGRVPNMPVVTDQGEFTFKLAEIPNGKYIERLNGGVEIERTAASHQVTNERKTDDDYPSAAAGSSVTRLATITSVADGTRQDAVKFVVKRS